MINIDLSFLPFIKMWNLILQCVNIVEEDYYSDQYWSISYETFINHFKINVILFSRVYRFTWVHCNIVTMSDYGGTYYSFSWCNLFILIIVIFCYIVSHFRYVSTFYLYRVLILDQYWSISLSSLLNHEGRPYRVS